MRDVGVLDSSPYPVSPGTTRAHRIHPLPSVLIVDDDAAVCKILARILGDENYKVTTSQSVQEAGSLIPNGRFDAYILDYRLVDGTGLDIVEQLRSMGNQAPVILISGYELEDLATKVQPLGISEIVKKPFSQQTICAVLEKSIADASPASERLPISGNRPATQQARQSSWKQLAILIALMTAIALLIFYFICR